MTQQTTTPNGTTTTTETAPEKSGNANVEAKFTQADLDRIAGTTREKATEAARKKLLEELGIEDPAADAELLKAAKKRKADELSEAEKATAELAKEKAKREAAETELKTFQEKVEAEKRAAALDSAITKALTAANAKAEKVLKLLKVDQPDALAAVLKEDGTVDETKLKALVEAARKAYPEDFKVPMGTFSLKDGRAVGSTPPKVKTSGHL